VSGVSLTESDIEDLPAPEPVMVLGNDKSFAKPKRPGQVRATENPIQQRAKIEEASSLEKAQEAVIAPKKPSAPVGLAGLGAAVAKRKQDMDDKGIKYEGKEESGKAAEVEELKPDAPPLTPGTMRMGIGMVNLSSVQLKKPGGGPVSGRDKKT